MSEKESPGKRDHHRALEGPPTEGASDPHLDPNNGGQMQRILGAPEIVMLVS